MRNSPFSFFDAIYCINLDTATQRWEEMRRRFGVLGIAQRVCRFSAVETPQLHHIGCGLSHRAVVELAQRRGLGNVLVFEDDAIFLDDTLELLENNLAELADQKWTLFYLGGYTWRNQYPNAPGCSNLRNPCGVLLTGTHAIAYNQSVYETILRELPEEIKGMTAWIANRHGIDMYFFLDIDHRFLCGPSVASQGSIWHTEDPELQERYTLGEVLAGDVFRLDGDWQVDGSGEQVMLNHRQNGQIALKGSAGIILKLVDGARTAAEIRGVLHAAYPESAAEIGRDVERTLANLVRWGAVTRS